MSKTVSNVLALFASFLIISSPTGGLNLIGMVSGGTNSTQDDMYMKIAEKYISASRLSDVRLSIVDTETGLPIAGTNIAYAQTSHDFIFTTEPWTFNDAALQLRGNLGAEYVETNFK